MSEPRNEPSAAQDRDWYSVQAGFWRTLWLVLCGGRLREWKHLQVGSVEDLLDEDDFAMIREEQASSAASTDSGARDDLAGTMPDAGHEASEPAPDTSATSSRSTTSAIGPDGRTIHFDDLVSDGDLVEVEGRPMIVYYDADAPDWFVGDEEEAVRRTFARHGMA